MQERQQPDRDPGPAPEGASVDLPAIKTPVIDIQDVERKPGPDTRVNNAGVKVHPQSDEARRKKESESAKEDAEAREAVAELERLIENQPPE
jgi:hypothetical protein